MKPEKQGNYFWKLVRPNPAQSMGECSECQYKMDTDNSEFSHFGSGIIIRCGRCKYLNMVKRNTFGVKLRYEKGVIGECPRCKKILIDQYEVFTKVCECGENVSMRYDWNEDRRPMMKCPDKNTLHHDALEKRVDPIIYVPHMI